ncbi:MAG: NAD(P)/FAD-dependent oxidoreductase [bacterium]
MINQEKPKTAIVLGAGPAGLAAALELVQKNYQVTVFERDEVVGGISRTTEYHGYRFDMGGHRFFTKNREVEAWWHAALKSDFQRTPRLSRIYYNRRFFKYPIAIKDALNNAGIGPSLLWFLSFLRYKIKPIRPEKSFADWVTNRFGKRLFETFFKSYTEKVWGIPTTELSAEWAVQRIKGLSLWDAVRNALIQSKDKETSLIEEFNYPKYGPGMMYEAVAAQVKAAGGTILTGHHVSGLRHQDGKVVGIEVTRDGVKTEYVADVVVSTIPLPDTLSLLFPGQPEVAVTARNMRFRDFISVNLILDQPEVFPDTWIYVHDPTVKLGRVQNFKNWSRWMTPTQEHTPIGCEYFCTAGDALWNTPDKELLELAATELKAIGLGGNAMIKDGCVCRVSNAYPMYTGPYKEAITHARTLLSGLSNLQVAGRGGMFRYNNMDHSILSGWLAARNLMGQDCSPWDANTESEYHEER